MESGKQGQGQSIGVAAIEPDHLLSREETMQRADRARYRAMREGRNRVAMAG